MRLRIELGGVRKLLDQLDDLGEDVEAITRQVVQDLAEDTRVEAVRGIQSGPASGSTYTRGNVSHTASAPGEYPMSDTGRLASSVQVEVELSGPRPRADVGTNIEYGPMLEFGTSRMAARPWLLPSFNKAKLMVEQDLKDMLEARL